MDTESQTTRTTAPIVAAPHRDSILNLLTARLISELLGLVLCRHANKHASQWVSNLNMMGMRDLCHTSVSDPLTLSFEAKIPVRNGLYLRLLKRPPPQPVSYQAMLSVRFQKKQLGN